MPVITKRLLDAIKPTGKLQIVRDDELTGFGVQVTPAGRISFCVTYTVGGNSKRKVIGRFGPMTVEKGRRAALAHLATASSGEDPLPDHANRFKTVDDLFAAWIERHVSVHLKPNSARAYRESYDAHCRKRLGKSHPAQLRYADFAQRHAQMADTPSAANHMLRTMRAMLSWAQDQRLVSWKDGNPARGHRLYREEPSERILSVEEIRVFIAKLPTAPMSVATQRVLMLELLLAQRSGEIAGMRRGDIDLASATWTLPAAATKANRQHVVPLPPWSRDIIADALKDSKGPYLFPSPAAEPTGQAAAAIDSHALSTALRRAQRPLERDEDDEAEEAKWVFDFRDGEGRPAPISPHDLRRTCSSYLELLGFGDSVRGAILNHSQRRNVTAKHYSAAELVKLKRSALLQWEAALRQIVQGADPFASRREDDRAEEERVLGLLSKPSSESSNHPRTH